MAKIETALSHFEYEKLPEKMQIMAVPFYDLASKIIDTLPESPEREQALRKLLTARAISVEICAQTKE